MGYNPSNNPSDNGPVDNVSWNDCMEFLKKLRQMTGIEFRLPTEAQWEYAAKGGSASKAIYMPEQTGLTICIEKQRWLVPYIAK